MYEGGTLQVRRYFLSKIFGGGVTHCRRDVNDRQRTYGRDKTRPRDYLNDVVITARFKSYDRTGRQRHLVGHSLVSNSARNRTRTVARHRKSSWLTAARRRRTGTVCYRFSPERAVAHRLREHIRTGGPRLRLSDNTNALPLSVRQQTF